MRITRIYQSASLSSDREIELDATASQHLIKVLRLREGAAVVVFDGLGNSFEGTLVTANVKSAVIKLHQQINQQTESPLQLHVGLGISKGERMDYAIQKLVETGVHSVTPLITERTVVKLDRKREKSRRQHWQGVIISACEQCGRNVLPELHDVCDFSEWATEIKAERKLVFDASGDTNLKTLQPIPQSVAVLVGPEGGLSNQEVEYASRQNFINVKLGPRILRTETAAVAISAALQTLWGDY